MTTHKNPSKLIVCCLYVTLYFSSCIASSCRFREDGGDGIKGMFVFGSSLVDNGNNNFLTCKAKADYLPYGIDFPNGPSGRFTNGRNVIDLVGEKLGLPSFIPPFKDPSTKGSKIVVGVNHASGSSGILNDTGSVAYWQILFKRVSQEAYGYGPMVLWKHRGSILGNVVSLSQQILDFEEVTLPELEAQLGCNASQSLSSYLFFVGIGGNDYMFNYFLRKSYLRISVETFTADLITSLSQKLQKLYSLGGQKFVLTAVYPLGYSPVVNKINIFGTPRALNKAAEVYNTQLKTMLDNLKIKMPADFNFVLINTNNIVTSIVQNPASTGFQDTTNACCQVVPQILGGNGVACDRGGKACANRTTHVFYDGLHPTEAVNVQIAVKAYASTNVESDVYPINVKQLAQL